MIPWLRSSAVHPSDITDQPIWPAALRCPEKPALANLDFLVLHSGTVVVQIARINLVAALILMLGWHWGILQCLAWIGMTVDYSQSMPISAAVAKALSGEEQCGICEFVDDGRELEEESTPFIAPFKHDLFWQPAVLSIFPPVLANLDCREAVSRDHPDDPPPTPPPRYA